MIISLQMQVAMDDQVPEMIEQADPACRRFALDCAEGQGDVAEMIVGVRISGKGQNIGRAILITVIDQNDASVLSGIEGPNVDYTENDPPTQITNSIAIADIDDRSPQAEIGQAGLRRKFVL